MGRFERAVALLRRHARRRLAWRSLLAAPFAASLFLTVVLGPSTIDHAHASFAWLAIASLTAAALLLVAADSLLVPIGLVSFLVFPLLAGLGFDFAPAWAGPIVAIVFYGSIAASAAAIITGIDAVLRRAVRRHRRALAIAAGSAGVLALGAVAIVMAGGNATVQASAPSMTVVNMGPVINTSQREAEPTFSADDIWTSRRVNGMWTPPENVGPKVNSAASEHHSMPGPDGQHFYVTSDRPGGYGGEDVYVTTRETDGTWRPLVNLGSPINGPANDRCLTWTPDGTILLFDSDRPGSRGSKDLWWAYAKDVTVTGLTRATESRSGDVRS